MSETILLQWFRTFSYRTPSSTRSIQTEQNQSTKRVIEGILAPHCVSMSLSSFVAHECLLHLTGRAVFQCAMRLLCSEAKNVSAIVLSWGRSELEKDCAVACS